jgi:hypothetical protein
MRGLKTLVVMDLPYPYVSWCGAPPRIIETQHPLALRTNHMLRHYATICQNPWWHVRKGSRATFPNALAPRSLYLR